MLIALAEMGPITMAGGAALASGAASSLVKNPGGIAQIGPRGQGGGADDLDREAEQARRLGPCRDSCGIPPQRTPPRAPGLGELPRLLCECLIQPGSQGGHRSRTGLPGQDAAAVHQQQRGNGLDLESLRERGRGVHVDFDEFQ